MVIELVDGVTANDIEEALFAPGDTKEPYRSSDGMRPGSETMLFVHPAPSKDKSTVSQAQIGLLKWLRYVQVVPLGTRVATTGYSGSWTKGTYRWPLWDCMLSGDAIRSVVTIPNLRDIRARTPSAGHSCCLFITGRSKRLERIRA